MVLFFFIFYVLLCFCSSFIGYIFNFLDDYFFPYVRKMREYTSKHSILLVFYYYLSNTNLHFLTFLRFLNTCLRTHFNCFQSRIVLVFPLCSLITYLFSATEFSFLRFPQNVLFPFSIQNFLIIIATSLTIISIVCFIFFYDSCTYPFFPSHSVLALLYFLNVHLANTITCSLWTT